MLEQISGHKLAEWQAYDRLDPFGYQRHDLLAGIIASTDANINRGKKSKAFEAADFMPHFGPRKRKSHAELKLALMAFVAAFGGNVEDMAKGGTPSVPLRPGRTYTRPDQPVQVS